jgi:hypothetical protein
MTVEPNPSKSAPGSPSPNPRLLTKAASVCSREPRLRDPEGTIRPGGDHPAWARHFAWLPINTIDRGMVWMRPYWARVISIKPIYIAVYVVDRERMF